MNKPADPDVRPAGRVLIVDDDAYLLQSFRMALRDAGYAITTAETTSVALTQCNQRLFDVCLLDVSLGDDSGLDLLPKLQSIAPGMSVIMVSAESQLDTAMTAFERGASDYLVKPCSPEQLRIAVARQLKTKRLAARVEALEREVQTPGDAELESAAPAMQRVVTLAKQVAGTDANILILGENGTGKGVLARAIHRWSGRSGAEFATVNCPSLSAELLESELFGHNKGAFTGATQSNPGRVAQADGGTLFLDEIGDLPLALQPKLLRFIQEKQYERVGDPVTRRADVRLVTATNRDLATMCAQGTFRQDLFYRLNVINIVLPPLRERRADIAQIAQRLLRRFAENYGRPARQFSPEAQSCLQAQDWPGNVRELQNTVERAVILGTEATIGLEAIAAGVASVDAVAMPAIGADVTLAELERLHLEAVLARAETLDAAAKTLGIDASTLYRKRKSFGID